MKLRCPGCKKTLTVPDKYAGKAIRCPACKHAFAVPKPTEAVGLPTAGASRLDLEGLAALEARANSLEDEDQVLAHAAHDARKVAEAGTSNLRKCPNCGKQTPIADPRIELLCSHCWKPIPAIDQAYKPVKKSKEYTSFGPGAFYGGLAGCVAYPIPALAGLLTAGAIALGAGIVPVTLMTGAADLMEQGNVGTVGGPAEADLSGNEIVLMAIFGLEIFFFSAVALHVFLDVIRTTSVGTDAPPALSWGPAQWGKSLLNSFILAVYYALAVYVVATLTIDPGNDSRDLLQRIMAGEAVDFLKTGGTPFAVGMVAVSCFIPMSLLGMGLGTIAQALNPVNIFKSIGRTHAHYIFLVLIVCVYGALFGAAFLAILQWFLPKVSKMATSSAEGNLLDVALGLLAWGVVMVFFFGTYVLGRLHGLFAKSFRKQLLFGAENA